MWFGDDPTESARAHNIKLWMELDNGEEIYRISTVKHIKHKLIGENQDQLEEPDDLGTITEDKGESYIEWTSKWRKRRYASLDYSHRLEQPVNGEVDGFNAKFIGT